MDETEAAQILNKLNSNLESLTTKAARPFNASDEVKDLFAALSKAQSKIEGAKKDSNNPYFKSKYADLASCWDAVREPLAQNDLAIAQIPTAGTETVTVVTVLTHKTGQWISNTVELKPTKADPQGCGSAMTYARRYGLMAICGIAPEDDDGNGASAQKTSAQNRPPRSSPAGTAKKAVTQPQLVRLNTLSTKNGWTHDEMKNLIGEVFDLKSSKELNQEQYQEICNLVQKDKNEVNLLLIDIQAQKAEAAGAMN